MENEVVAVFGAHPDDCELSAGGVAAKWAAQGHHVKFVSVTNGDIGHWREAGGPLAKRRLAEVMETARILAEPHQLEVFPRGGLREISHGHWEGRKRAEVERPAPRASNLASGAKSAARRSPCRSMYSDQRP